MNRVRKAAYMVAELALRLCVNPYWRGNLLRLLGAKIGQNVRIYEVQFINLDDGFHNLTVGNDVHIGTGCLLDLCAPIAIGEKSTISLRTTILTHADPGSHQGSFLCAQFPPVKLAVRIGNDCWIGCNSTILHGVSIGDRTVVGAASLVRRDADADSIYFGVPARRVRSLAGEHTDARRVSRTT